MLSVNIFSLLRVLRMCGGSASQTDPEWSHLYSLKCIKRVADKFLMLEGKRLKRTVGRGAHVARVSVHREPGKAGDVEISGRGF